MTTKSCNRPITAGGLPAAEAGGGSDERRLRVLCVMLSSGQGGLEQSLLDYCEALAGTDQQVVALVHPDWLGISELERLGIERATFSSLGEWDPFAAARLRRLLAKRLPDVVLTIGRRGSLLVRRALARLPGAPPQVAVTPNYSLAHLVGLDHVIATTEDLRRALIEAGQPEHRISVVPNMIRLPDPPPAGAVAREAPVIGALGRFVAKKGFADLIDALALLRAQGRRFTARLGGDGPDAAALRARVAGHALADRVEFLGWVTDKRAFFEAIDIFCVPSLHEPFGIVVLEGMAHGRPMVVTDAEGPREIVQAGVSGLIVPRGNPERLAEALATLLEDAALREQLAAEGLRLVRQAYDLPVVGSTIAAELRAIVGARAAATQPQVTGTVHP